MDPDRSRTDSENRDVFLHDQPVASPDFPPRSQQHGSCSTDTTVRLGSSDLEQQPGSESNAQLVKRRRLFLITSSDSQYSLIAQRLNHEIDSSWAATIIVLCYFVAGLIDSVAYSIWNSFVNIQTGNTILLALNIAGQPEGHHPLSWVKSFTSVVSYCIGSLIFNLIHRAPAPSRFYDPKPPLSRWGLMLSFFVQGTILVTVAILAHTGILSTNEFVSGTFSNGTPGNPGNNFRDLAAISLLGFEAAGQVSLSRTLMINDLPTLVISTLYHDFFADVLRTGRCWNESETAWAFVVSQKRQVRRLSSILAMFIGALISGFVSRSKAKLSAVMWIAAAVKFGICIGWYSWPEKKAVVKEVEPVKEVKR